MRTLAPNARLDGNAPHLTPCPNPVQPVNSRWQAPRSVKHALMAHIARLMELRLSARPVRPAQANTLSLSPAQPAPSVPQPRVPSPATTAITPSKAPLSARFVQGDISVHRPIIFRLSVQMATMLPRRVNNLATPAIPVKYAPTRLEAPRAARLANTHPVSLDKRPAISALPELAAVALQ